MTTEQPDVIAFVAHDPILDEVLLVMAEQRERADRGELLSDLQTKCNTYLVYTTAGRLQVDYPSTAGKRVHVQLRSVQPPGVRELGVLGLIARNHFDQVGIKLSWKTIGHPEEHRV